MRMDTKRRRRLAKDRILEALRIDAAGDPIPEFPDEKFHLGNTEALSHEQVRSGAYMLMCLYDLPSGNSGGRNLYELLDLYFRNNEARDQMNRVIKQFGRDVSD